MVKIRQVMFMILFSGVLFVPSAAMAQFPIVGAEEVKAWMSKNRKVMLIDARPTEEYAAAHIPGAINIPAESVRMEKARLPKGKATPLIFYCRGEG